jgi:ADP-ribosyl-[dinitrogen reductase] hydrolase
MADIANLNQIKGVFFGIAIGDALGVPAEFMSRTHLKQNPINGFNSNYYNVENRGVWSDDSSLTFCLAETIIEEFSIDLLGKKIKAWYQENYWAPRDVAFEIGIATHNAIDRLEKGMSASESGENGEYSNGNGSLMRVAPLAFSLLNESIEERFQTIKSVSAITHAHIRSIISCFFYVEFLQNLMKCTDKFEAFECTQNTVRDYINSTSCNNDEKSLFLRLFYDKIQDLDEDEIFSSAYVIHTLEASIWSFLNTESYEAAILKAVNLGHDTDTTGSVTGALAGIYYGAESIDRSLKNSIVRTEEIENLTERFYAKIKYILN